MKFADSLPKSAHHLIAIPNNLAGDGPKGVLVACEDYIIYKNHGVADVAAKIPRRHD